MAQDSAPAHIHGADEIEGSSVLVRTPVEDVILLLVLGNSTRGSRSPFASLSGDIIRGTMAESVRQASNGLLQSSGYLTPPVEPECPADPHPVLMPLGKKQAVFSSRRMPMRTAMTLKFPKATDSEWMTSASPVSLFGAVPPRASMPTKNPFVSSRIDLGAEVAFVVNVRARLVASSLFKSGCELPNK